MGDDEEKIEEIEEKANAIEEEYGWLASYYAKERSDAAVEIGDQRAGSHWQRVAEKIRDKADDE